MELIKEKLKQIELRVNSLQKEINVDNEKKKMRELEAKSLKSDFWKNEQQAREVMRQIAHIQENLESIDSLQEKTQSAMKLIHLAIEEKTTDQSFIKDIETEVKTIEKLLQKLELQTFFSGKYDTQDAILSIHSGQGGVEAMDWAAMLFRMYVRFLEKRELKSDIIEETPGEEAGIKSATILVSGKNAYGTLKGEAGTHRLVRQSPFNADKLRQTSFALVEVLPRITEPKEVDLKDEDIQFQAFRSSGHGGQNVNKVSTAVRLKHLPTGIVVECQAQRHQEQNRKIARELLAAKLWEKKQKKHKEKMSSIKGEHKIAGWGNQIRSYVLHPYHMVKDLRTNVETSDTESVLKGDLDIFIEAQIRQLV